jgi:pSer/pThr/pTyr-binding forkhead associated (FHA) protein
VLFLRFEIIVIEKEIEMPQITLKYKNKILPVKYKNTVLQKYPVSIGQTVTIGRNDSNDIVIDNMAVSGAHARIDSIAATFILTDLESTNGTFVNDQLISTHGLRNNDVILIGKHELIFDRSDLEQKATARGEDIQDDKTCVLDTTEYRELINQTKVTGTNTSPKDSSRTSSDKGGGFFSKIFKK